MSLIWHLRKHLDSPAGEFLQRRFSHPRRITLTANQQLQQTRRRLPSTPYCPYGTLDRAINYRIRYSFALTPAQELGAWTGAFEHLTWNAGYDYVTGDSGPYPLNVMESFFEHLKATLQTLQPVGQSLDKEAEQVLARYCFVLALLEEVARNQSYRSSPLVIPRPRKSVDELLAIPREEWIDDLCGLIALFYKRYGPLLTLPHVLKPALEGCKDIGPSDADLIVDGCLIVIKADVEQCIQATWLRHLAGCVLLDYNDLFHINAVGLYMVRRGKLVSWPFNEFLRLLTGGTTVDITSLRKEFRTCCQQTFQLWSDELL
jgi:hypothetical protein